MERILRDLIDRNFDEQLHDLQDSIRIKSCLDEAQITEDDPFGANLTSALISFLDNARRLGFKTCNIENYVGYVDLGDTGDLIGILVHLDVVPEGNHDMWIVPPYSAEISDGKLYGRGSMDDKGPALAALYAMKAIRDSGMKLSCRFRLIVGLDEESGGRCIARYLETEEIPAYSFSPDASFPLINAEKGILRGYFNRDFSVSELENTLKLNSITGGNRYNVVPDEAVATFDGIISDKTAELITATRNVSVKLVKGQTIIKAGGLSAHAMEPEHGENAITALLKVLTVFEWGPIHIKGYFDSLAGILSDYNGAGLGIAGEDNISGKLTCNLAIINCSTKSCKISLDIRYPVTFDGNKVISDMNKTIAKIDTVFQAEKDKKPLFVSPDTHIVKRLLTAYKNITGQDGVPESIGGGTYCRYLSNAVSFGPLFPGEIELAHQPNENIPLETLRKITYIYAEALRLFAS